MARRTLLGVQTTDSARESNADSVDILEYSRGSVT